jgi:LysM repeat protein
MFKKTTLLALYAASQLFVLPNLEAAPKTYQVTGPIIELTDKTIVVQKGDERWEIARDENTKLKGELKVGQKVTIHYRMIATTIENKTVAPESGSTPKP